MLDRTKWKHHPDPVFAVPNGALEDFVAVPVPAPHPWAAYYCAGPDLQDQRLWRAQMRGPFGPIEPPTARLSDRGHTRLYRGAVSEDLHIITAVWPGLPRVGLWTFEQFDFGLVKELLVPPKEGTLYSIAAANPGVVTLGGASVYIFFEGRGDWVFWRLFQATWDRQTDKIEVDDQPLWDGANPSPVVDPATGRLFLYYSAYRIGAPGFETRVAWLEPEDLPW